MRKVRLLVLPGALLVKVSLSLGDTFGERTLDEKKDTHQFKEEVSKHPPKRVGLYST